MSSAITTQATPRFRKLRIAWSLAWGIVSLLLIMLWVRSYTAVDVVSIAGDSYKILEHTVKGRLRVSVVELSDLSDRTPWRFTSFPPEPGPSGENFWTFSLHKTMVDVSVSLPLWFSVLAFAGLAAVPWLPLWRFSMRTLLIAVTAVALLLGLIIYATQG